MNRQSARRSWLEWLETNISRPNNVLFEKIEQTDTLIDILSCCLSDRTDIALKALRVVILSSFWTLNRSFSQQYLSLNESLFALWGKVNSEQDKIYWISHMAVYILLTHSKSKEIESFINQFVFPVIQDSVDQMYDESLASSENSEHINMLDEALKVFLLLIGYVERRQRYTIVEKTHHLFVELLEYPIVQIKLTTFNVCVSFGEMIYNDSDETNYGIDMDDMLKAMTRCMYENDDILTKDESSLMEDLIERVRESNYDETVPSVIIKSYNTPKEKKKQPPHLRNKKEHPTTGYTISIAISYIQKRLGHVYSELTDPSNATGFLSIIDAIIDETYKTQS